MHREGNVIGPNVAKFRYQRNLTQDELVGKLQLFGVLYDPQYSGQHRDATLPGDRQTD